MNVIVSNKQKSIIDNANIDAIKDLNGIFNIDDLISKFKNYFFSKMILDATSIIDFASKDVLNKLANDIGSERLFILLPSKPEPPKSFIENLNSLHIYNYSTNINELVELIKNPRISVNNSINSSINENFYNNDSMENNNFDTNNNYQDIGAYKNINGDFYSNMSINNGMAVSNMQSVNSYNEVSDQSSNIQNFDSDKMPINNDVRNNDINISNNVNKSINNINENSEFSNSDVVSNTSEVGIDNDSVNNNFLNMNGSDIKTNKTIIGFKNVTTSAGSTSLVYMLTRKLVKTYGKRAVALEINKNDFRYYQENFFLNSSEQEVHNKILNCKADIILVDLNNCRDTSFCTDIIYLIEPSIIKLNMIMMTIPLTFKNLKGCKLVLNKSLLSPNEINAFANEAGTPIFYNIPPVNDRVENSVLDDLLNNLKLI